MRPFIVSLICVALAHAQTAAPTPAAPPPTVKSAPGILPEGTAVRMRINRTVSSADANQGDNVDFETLDDVKLGDAVVIPKGSTAMATITEAVPSGEWAVAASSI